MRKLPILLAAAACGLALPVQAAVYSCVNAKGEKTISDKPCAPSQSTQRVYAAPRPAIAEDAPPPPESAPRSPLMPQSPEEIEAMLRARERLQQGLPAEGSAEERAWLEAIEREKQELKRREPQRQMERYLQEKEGQREQWRSERQGGYARDLRQQENTQTDCNWLRQRKERHTNAAREAYSYGSPSSRAAHIAAEREMSQRLNQAGCN